MSDICLENRTAENTSWFSMSGKICKCKCISVYDSDTVTLVIPFEKEYYKVRCRLEGIDGAEIRTKDPREKAHAIKSKNRLSELIENKIIWIDCHGYDKYGRLLGRLFREFDDIEQGNSINHLLVREGLVIEYDGGRKKKFNEWM